MSNRLSREKINYLARQILNVLEKNDQVEFLDDPNEIRLVILRTIEDEMKLYESLDKKAIEKIQSQKKAIEEGMLTLRMSGLEKIKQGITTIEEVLRETVL